MNIRRVHRRIKATPTELASYFGLVVEITLRMTIYSLICWRDREIIVETGDLLMAQPRLYGTGRDQMSTMPVEQTNGNE